MEHCVETHGFSEVYGINTMCFLQPQTYLTIRYLRDHPQKINILQTGVQKIGLFSQDKLYSLNYLRILNDFPQIVRAFFQRLLFIYPPKDNI